MRYLDAPSWLKEELLRDQAEDEEYFCLLKIP
jgi:hypothetical protein